MSVTSWWRRKSALLLVMAILCGTASAASFRTIDEVTSGAWRAVLYENENGARRFCALESDASDGSVFRVALYLDNRDAFIEVYNPSWSLREAAATFSFAFDNGMRAELRGQTYPTAYVYNLIDKRRSEVLLGMLGVHNRVDVKNANGETVAQFSLRGSGAMVGAFAQCAGGL